MTARVFFQSYLRLTQPESIAKYLILFETVEAN